MDDLVSRSAASLARAIRGKEVSSVEVIEAHLKRIDEVNPKINAIAQRLDETALKQAQEADDAVVRGELKGPLHGVPFTCKDALEVEGIICAVGTTGRANYVPKQTATSVTRMRGAGGILLAKTNVPECSATFETDNLVYGRTNNPYDLERTPSGSSGGEAALIASGGSPVGLGSDAGGSIRMPAHFCGIAGIKPSVGRVPRTGHWPEFKGSLDWLAHVGPLARYVEDLALTLPILSGEDEIDPFIINMTLSDPKAVNVSGLRVAFFTDNGIRAAREDTAGVVRSAAQIIEQAGCRVEETRPDVLEQTGDIYNDLYRGEGGSRIRRILEQAGTTDYSPLNELEQDHEDKLLTGAEYCRLLEKWDEYRYAMLAFMRERDVIVCPTNVGPAVPHGSSFDRYPDFYYTFTDNLTGNPAVVVRGGTSEEGLPIGVQVVAKRWRDDIALAVAAYLEDAMEGWQPPDL